jgi:hypothetical protein
MNHHICSVQDCSNQATAEVMLYDVYESGEVFFERDFTCPYLCPQHVAENEASIQGERNPETITNYKYTNQHSAQGFTVYRPL